MTGSGGPGSDGTLVGRAAELEHLRDFVDTASRDGGVLLLTGEAGVGKSVLLDEAARAAAASGARVLFAAGVEFEAEISFSGLNQLLMPVLDDLPALGPAHRDALAVSLGFGSGPAADRLVVSTAALTLLRHVASRSAVLLVADDVQWLDRANAGVLAFIARRVAGAPLGFLGARRTGNDGFFADAGLPEHEVQPLDPQASAELMRRRHPFLAPKVGQRVIAAAQGNPLALIELPAALTGPQQIAVQALPAVLPLSGHLQSLFAARMDALPAATRRLLLLAALDGSGDLEMLRAASGYDGWLDDLAPAEEARLVRVDAGLRRISLGHPLIASAVVELSTSGDRRRAHHTLAEVLDDQPDRRAWHLAEAAVGSDERAADLLDEASHRALRKGDAVAAVTALLQAADLSGAGRERARRLAEAAYIGADVVGELRTVPRLLLQARWADPDSSRSLTSAVAGAHHLLHVAGDIQIAHRMLARAIEDALRSTDTPDLDDALHTLMVVCHFGGRPDLWQPFESALDRLGPRVSPALAVSRRTFADAARAEPADLRALQELVDGIDTETDPAHVIRIAIAGFFVDRLDGCRQALRDVARAGRDGGPGASAVNALLILCHEAVAAGRWDEAGRTAEEGIELAEALGYRLISLPGMYALALLAAARGEEERTQTLAAELVTWATPRCVHVVEHYAAHARALAALGRGDFEEAYRQASSISPPGVFADHAPLALWVSLDLVEAAVRTDRRAVAAAHVAAMKELSIFGLCPRVALLAAGSAALVAPSDRAADLFEQALSVPGAEQYPFELARVRLAYGEHLRRTRETQDSRVQLSGALDVFRGLGAQPWAARAEQELRAGGRARPAAGATDVVLTHQEHQIAQLAASGMTNRQIGTQLYLSPRTVSAHLYRVFPRLGITSRAALRDALAHSIAPEEIEG